MIRLALLSLVFAVGAGYHMTAQTARSSQSREMLAAHNAVRTKVRVPALSWSDKLAAVAQQWADTLIARNQFAHHPHPQYGENLFEISGGSATPSRVVDSWASEASNYDRRANACRGGACGHYTQIVWRDTRTVGCAVARGHGREVWVCEYEPHGNTVGEKPY
jgi:Uncharacterized protein with SCP/PR1 domains